MGRRRRRAARDVRATPSMCLNRVNASARHAPALLEEGFLALVLADLDHALLALATSLIGVDDLLEALLARLASGRAEHGGVTGVSTRGNGVTSRGEGWSAPRVSCVTSSRQPRGNYLVLSAQTLTGDETARLAWYRQFFLIIVWAIRLTSCFACIGELTSLFWSHPEEGVVVGVHRPARTPRCRRRRTRRARRWWRRCTATSTA